MSLLFSPFRLGALELANRVIVSPMCQYVAEAGVAGAWHRVHLGQLSLGSWGLVMIEATHVSPEGRITPGCLGLWNDEQAEALAPILDFARRWGTSPMGIQLAHAGRKGSARVPLAGGAALQPEEGAWETVGPSALPYGPGWHTPSALDEAGLDKVEADFVAAARRAAALGFVACELHMAHGYLLHAFLSPLANHRGDRWGGTLENRLRFPLRLFEAVRAVWPVDRPLGARLSATDWVEGGWDLEQTLVMAERLGAIGCDFLDVSSGGLDPRQQLHVGPGYQVPFARAVRAATGLPTIAVGLVTDPHQAEAILDEGSADLIALARAAMDDPRWPWHAARALGQTIDYPPQYARAHPSRWRPA